MLTLQMSQKTTNLARELCHRGEGSFCNGFGLQRFLPRPGEGDPQAGVAWKSTVCVRLPLQHSLTKPARCTGGAMKILGKETQEGERRTRVCDTRHPNPRILC